MEITRWKPVPRGTGFQPVMNASGKGRSRRNARPRLQACSQLRRGVLEQSKQIFLA